MKKLVYKLRSHPLHIRQKILFTAMIASCAALFGLWLLSFSHTASTTNEKTSIKKDLAPFAMLKSVFTDNFPSFSSVKKPPAASVQSQSTPETTIDQSTYQPDQRETQQPE